jgi:tetratricopeptide (TPR) repeat protein
MLGVCREVAVRSGLAVMAFGAVAGIWTAAQLFHAEWVAASRTEAGLRAAVKSVPGNSEYWNKLARVLAGSGRHMEAERAWERALEANPQAVEALLRLGIQAEMEGRFRLAERYLLAAAGADKGYDPRWALLNFYFRRGRWEDFWRWAPDACERAYSDRRPLFDLYWNSGASAAEVFEKGVVRSGRPTLRSYVHYLIGCGEIEATKPAAALLLKSARTDDASALRAYGEALLVAKRGRAAQAVWEELTRLGMASGQNSGFEWRVRNVQGAPVTLDAVSGEVRVAFSGRQPESCEILSRYVAMEPGSPYLLKFRYRTKGVPAGAGLRMVLAEKAVLDLGSDEWADAQMALEAGEADLGRVALRYTRARGYTRIEGTIWIREFRWERAR